MTPAETLELSMIERLLSGREVAESQQAGSLLRRFHAADWIAPSGRKDKWIMAAHAKASLEARRSKLWPSRETDFALLQAAGLSSDKPASYAHLPSLRRRPVPSRGFVNEKTWSANFGAGPKASAWLAAPDEVAVTHDACSRIRPNHGLLLERDGSPLDLCAMAQLLGEVPIPQRALLKGARFTGTLPQVVLTLENLGAYVDVKLPDNMMAVYSPGHDLRCATQILNLLPNTAWVHFGDLDPEGIDIAHSLARATGRPTLLYVPEFAPEYLDMAQKTTEWNSTPQAAIFDVLRARGRGIFQEVFLLDPRLPGDLTTYAADACRALTASSETAERNRRPS